MIYILNDDGTPLMPSTRKRHLMQLVKQKKAHIVSDKPFTIKLHYHSPGVTQPLHGGIDPGRTNIGVAVRTKQGKVIYLANVQTRNKDIPKLMAERKEHRQASRRGERLNRKRLAKKHNTCMKDGKIHRHLPGYDEGDVFVKDIINTEARFNNRQKKDPLCPTVRQLIQTHLNIVRKVCKILPVDHWSIEINQFAFARMDDHTCYGVDFQNGRMKGYTSVSDYVFQRQDGKCYCCGKPIEHYHHLVERSKGGSDLPENILGVCKDCHEKIHTGQMVLDIKGIRKKYGALSVLNQAIPYIYGRLYELFGKDHITTCFGYETQAYRKTNHIAKDHNLDALCIASIHLDQKPVMASVPETFMIRQFRRHERNIIRAQRERTYKQGKTTIAKNRRPRYAQPVRTPALSVWYQNRCREVGKKQAQKERSTLSCKSATRYYNNMKRVMPGAVFMYQDNRYILSGQLNGGRYYRALGDTKTNYPAKKCYIIRHNTGLVYA